MTAPRVLIAGVGNIFLGDDAFGVEVVKRLAERPLTEAVRVADFGIRGIDLAFALQDGYEAVVLVDAVPRGGQPGTLYTLEPEPEADDEPPPDPAEMMIDAHNLDPAKVLRLATAMGGRTRRVLLIGCEPWMPESEADFQMELSAPVRAAVEEAAPLIESVVAELLNENPGKEARGESETPVQSSDAGSATDSH